MERATRLAIVDPQKLTKFFASGASGHLVQGESVTWTFADVGARLSPEVRRIDKHLRKGRLKDTH